MCSKIICFYYQHLETRPLHSKKKRLKENKSNVSTLSMNLVPALPITKLSRNLVGDYCNNKSLGQSIKIEKMKNLVNIFLSKSKR